MFGMQQKEKVTVPFGQEPAFLTLSPTPLATKKFYPAIVKGKCGLSWWLRQ